MSVLDEPWTKPELMACCGAREIRDHDRVMVGTGFPTVAANIAKHIQAPNAVMGNHKAACRTIV